MTNSWKPTNRMTDDTVLFDAIGKIRESSDKRREIEARVLAENNLASVRQLSEDKKKKFCAIVDALLEDKPDVNTQLFPEDNAELVDAASKIKTTTWGTITEGINLQEISPQKAQQVYKKTGDALKKAQAAGDENTVRKREKGNFMAYRRVTGAPLGKRPQFEETEGLQELSKDTLKSYHKKAHKDVGQKVLSVIDKRNKDWKSAAPTLAKVTKRQVGMNRASAKLKKEDIVEAILEMEGLRSINQLTESGLAKLDAIVEQIMLDEKKNLNELSKSTLASYTNKASKSIGVHGFSRAFHGRQAGDAERDGGKALRMKNIVKGANAYDKAWGKAMHHGTMAANAKRKMNNRIQGVERATSRLAKEDTDLQELSKSTLARYIIKAHTSGTAAAASQENAYMRGHKRNSEQFKKAGETGEKREQGIQRAAYKMALKKEDTVEEGLISRVTNAAKRLNKATQTTRDRIASSEKRISKRPDSKAKSKALGHVDNTRRWINDPDEYPGAGMQHIKNHGFGYIKKAYGKDQSDKAFVRNLKKEDADLQVEGTPTPNPKGAPRGERDSGDYKNPTGWANKDVDKATLIARKQAKLKGARKVPQEAW